jgi:lipopolysaccharide biosynthesis glycosyltransferase
MLKMFIGWDAREVDAFNVCYNSIKQTSSISMDCYALKRDELQTRGEYWRDIDPHAATEFAYTRFLIPYLCNYTGWAIFCDCDFLWLNDIKNLFKDIEKNNKSIDLPVYVCKHDYIPKHILKMDNKPQSVYPKKNWSSLVLWNCGHPKNKILTPEIVNNKSGAYLHQFKWLCEEDIGEIPIQWNWLVDEYDEYTHGKPQALHYTNGGPWFDNYTTCSYADEWNNALLSTVSQKI